MGVAVGILQGEGRGLIAGLGCAIGLAAGDQLVGGAVHRFVDPGGCVVRSAAGFEIGAESVKFILQ